jgi:hypothetical protein
MCTVEEQVEAKSKNTMQSEGWSKNKTGTGVYTRRARGKNCH